MCCAAESSTTYTMPTNGWSTTAAREGGPGKVDAGGGASHQELRRTGIESVSPGTTVVGWVP